LYSYCELRLILVEAASIEPEQPQSSTRVFFFSVLLRLFIALMMIQHNCDLRRRLPAAAVHWHIQEDGDQYFPEDVLFTSLRRCARKGYWAAQLCCCLVRLFLSLRSIYRPISGAERRPVLSKLTKINIP
jgi:hypothetical protein